MAYATSGTKKHTARSYDAAGRLTLITDIGTTGVVTTYNYYLNGQRATESTTAPALEGHAISRSVVYTYDALGRMTRWADGATGMHLNTWFDADGNRAETYTDLGWDPKGDNAAGNPNYRYFHHVYTFDAAGRVTREVNRRTSATGAVTEPVVAVYTYDAANNRRTWNDGSQTWTYAYNANGRVTSATASSGIFTYRQAWTYDPRGNVLTFASYEKRSTDAEVRVEWRTTTYDSADRALVIETEKRGENDQITTNTYDRAGRLTTMVLEQSRLPRLGSEPVDMVRRRYTYNYTYHADGREKAVAVTGRTHGDSFSYYDANKNLATLNLGQGSGMDRVAARDRKR